MKIRTRFAPSPTGYMHVGNLRSAIFGYLVCKKENGDFILRIEDTDQTRTVPGATEFIYNTLKLCGLEIDEGPLNGGDYGPYIQSERLHIYDKYAKELVEKGGAYHCFCGEDRLEELRKEAELKKVPFLYDGHCRNLSKEEINEKIKNGEKFVIRQKIPKEGTTEYEDVVYGHMSFQNNLLEDQVLIKSDRYPTYNFANVIDDHLMDITHVIRGNEYLTATPKYNLLYDAFGFEKPTYIHLPWVVDENHKKLSKRHGAASFMDLYEAGYVPQGVVNYLTLLGWSPETTQEIFSLEELIQAFDPHRINKSPAVFDIKKLNWVNAHYIKKLSLDELYVITYPHLVREYGEIDEEWSKHLISIYQNHIHYGKEIVDVTKIFFTKEYNISDEAEEFLNEDKETVKKVLNQFETDINDLSDWSVEKITELIKEVGKKVEVKGKMLFMTIRIAVSGEMHGPELPDTIYLLGKEKVLENLKKI